jgi:hypothetical protein
MASETCDDQHHKKRRGKRGARLYRRVEVGGKEEPEEPAPPSPLTAPDLEKMVEEKNNIIEKLTKKLEEQDKTITKLQEQVQMMEKAEEVREAAEEVRKAAEEIKKAQEVRKVKVEVRPKRANYIGDSISHHVDTDKLEEATKMEITKFKAYGTQYNTNQRFPEKNFSAVVPQALGKVECNILILQSSSTDLTNLRDGNKDYMEQEVHRSNVAMLHVCEAALTQHTMLEKVILMERAPRYDRLHMLNIFANRDLQAEVNRSRLKDKILLGLHTLDCEGTIRQARYGIIGKYLVDGLHLRGAEGRAAYTNSVLHILQTANCVK